MNDGFAWWLVVLGIAIGVGLSWLVLGRLPRAEADIDEDERALEAAWISGAVGDYGGVAPPALVEEILELHEHYLQGPALDLEAHRDRDSDEAFDEADPADGAVRSRR
ncbi:MAG: hypothetical protein H0T04_03670 [Chloroflexi bacterium]|nr:hypothetical protein [Chloroflexota bacterium]